MGKILEIPRRSRRREREDAHRRERLRRVHGFTGPSIHRRGTETTTRRRRSIGPSANHAARALACMLSYRARVCYLRRARPASDATRIAPIPCGLLTGLLRRVAAASQRRARRDSPAHGGTPAYPLNDLRSLPSPRGALPPR